MIKHAWILLEVTCAKARSRSSMLLNLSMAVIGLGITFESFNGKALHSTRLVKPMQKDLTPNEQFLGRMEPIAVSIDSMASLATSVALVAAALATLWAPPTAIETTPGTA